MARKIIVTKNYPLIFINKLLEKLYCENNPLIYDFKPTLENIRKYNLEKKVF